MTVYETLQTLTNNGTRTVFDDRKRMQLINNQCWHREVRRVTYHKGYGYKQINAVLHV